MAKAGRPRNVRPHETKLNVPTDPLKNKVKRLYWALIEMEKKMAKDITSVRMKDYTDLLSAYEQGCIDLKKKGYVGRYAKKGMDTGGVVENGGQGSADEVGGNRSSGVGAGISAPNPLA